MYYISNAYLYIYKPAYINLHTYKGLHTQVLFMHRIHIYNFTYTCTYVYKHIHKVTYIHTWILTTYSHKLEYISPQIQYVSYYI
jgi:hypothetical protein